MVRESLPSLWLGRDIHLISKLLTLVLYHFNSPVQFLHTDSAFEKYMRSTDVVAPLSLPVAFSETPTNSSTAIQYSDGGAKQVNH